MPDDLTTQLRDALGACVVELRTAANFIRPGTTRVRIEGTANRAEYVLEQCDALTPRDEVPR